MRETTRLLDRIEPDTPPSRRYSRLLRSSLLELRDPNDGQDPDPATKTRHQYARAGGVLWSRRLPPESVGDEWLDGPARWERVDLGHASELLRAFAREGPEFSLAVLRRQRFYVAADDEYCVRGVYVDATDELAIDLPYGPVTDAWWDVPLPQCPDCGGDVVWWEAGYVPGTRRCVGAPLRRGEYLPDRGCGSMFVVASQETER